MRCGRKSHTRPRGPSESPDGVDPNIRRTRHNVTVITVGSKYEVYVWSPAFSHMQTLKQPFQTLAIKWEEYFCKEVFMRLYPASFLLVSSFLCLPLASSLMRRLSLCQYLPSIYMCISAWISRWQCNRNWYIKTTTTSILFKEQKQIETEKRFLKLLCDSLQDP